MSGNQPRNQQENQEGNQQRNRQGNQRWLTYYNDVVKANSTFYGHMFNEMYSLKEQMVKIDGKLDKLIDEQEECNKAFSVPGKIRNAFDPEFP